MTEQEICVELNKVSGDRDDTMLDVPYESNYSLCTSITDELTEIHNWLEELIFLTSSTNVYQRTYQFFTLVDIQVNELLYQLPSGVCEPLTIRTAQATPLLQEYTNWRIANRMPDVGVSVHPFVLGLAKEAFISYSKQLIDCFSRLLAKEIENQEVDFSWKEDLRDILQALGEKEGARTDALRRARRNYTTGFDAPEGDDY